ncbi:glyoxalase [bacterium (Candidatus Blackallbacteria) CG17_big_fil_post_rev_8_21_14_2_50_48_46]|uniref:Glyoxalase n=1 Tax=bacterium (Candidatus Blackallbacteria) CG17_big_fil_post_rev_8_21_14_2_50_48_46 TaxID=2014261 RepID=A0A2M7G129_9BACT|nr:MAG: glyoxalase [bacterium (Candidatus Blackallbacteria) CG18_big_fil_WC_8_21_14_2_50_49_26]PIW15382.1 MAG: glyoxalase [bacterium (Candidatus Blackallbacteria) CG17_big_fil_post_rev_8_21_14_2_50_48_46]PIW49757.1 MAG: glyoxalase [bacterium (Candidatus Blackallbacteria) CG13_big_fil_rev_8_21_14_2_50_49_14]
MQPLFVLYVADQVKSAGFYRVVLDLEPCLDVPGMTQFELHQGSLLGLMPETGIQRLLGDQIPDLSLFRGVPRAELYLRVAEPQRYHARVLAQGGKELSPLQKRGWGDLAAYSQDLDGHVLAFARSV